MTPAPRRRVPGPAAGPGTLIGVASIDITPPVGIVLAGYGPRTATAIGHRLRAEALVCGSGAARWALVSAEVLGFPLGFVTQVRRAIARRTGIGADRILIAATHTHSGPDVHAPRLRPGSAEAAYRRKLGGLLVEVTERAVASAAPGWLETAVCQAPKWGHNRRVRKPDGTWTNEWTDPQRRHRGYFDGSILLAGVRRSDGRLDALLVNYGCHPVVLGPGSLAISGDYVSYLKDALERRRIARLVLFGLGGHADINPPLCVGRSARQAQRMGIALARTIAAGIHRLRPVAAHPTGGAIEPWTFLRRRAVPAGKGLARSSPGRRQRSEVMALAAGGLGVVSVPGELFSAYMAMFRRASPFASTVVLSQGNDYVGYLPTDRADAEGAYEATMSPGPIETSLCRAAARALTRAQRDALRRAD